jgi:hypothetical protein
LKGEGRVPQITHRDLVAFADDRVNLRKSEVDDQRAQVNRLRDRIESKIAASPGYGFVKALHAADLLGLHITTAERWVGYARRDWTAYLAARDSAARLSAGERGTQGVRVAR